jgi:adenylosuccinate synthase
VLYSNVGSIFPEEYNQYLEILKPYIKDTVSLINGIIKEGKNILFEGAQGAMLDIDHGTYPFVTSSNTTSGGLCTGAGVGINTIKNLTGISKAYCTRVGAGPFPSEFDEKKGNRIREKGGEFGATTGRPRRCGALDLVALRHSVMINGLTDLAITKLDVLDGEEEIDVVTGYKLNGEIIDYVPGFIENLEKVEPIIEKIPGWNTLTVDITKWDDLDINAKAYIEFIEKNTGVRVAYVSTGPNRESTVIR